MAEITQEQILSSIDNGMDAEWVENGHVGRLAELYTITQDARFKPYLELCKKAVQDTRLLNGIIFCNDVLQVPPVKTFVIANKKAIEKIKVKYGEPAKDSPVNRCIGAFWGYIFRFILNYDTPINGVSISLKETNGDALTIVTATRFERTSSRTEVTIKNS